MQYLSWPARIDPARLSRWKIIRESDRRNQAPCIRIPCATSSSITRRRECAIRKETTSGGGVCARQRSPRQKSSHDRDSSTLRWSRQEDCSRRAGALRAPCIPFNHDVSPCPYIHASFSRYDHIREELAGRCSLNAAGFLSL